MMQFAVKGCCIAFLLVIMFVLLDSSAGRVDANKIVIASKRFTESYILGEILKQTAEKIGEAPVDYRPGLGNTGIVFAALREGIIDIYPEYTGTIYYEMLQRPDLASHPSSELNAYLQPLGLAVSESLGFHDNYALAMRKERAEKLGIQTISDLAVHPELIFGFSPEFIGRGDGWSGLKKSGYQFPQKEVMTIDHSLGYEALDQHKIDVIDIYSTDPKIQKYHLKVLVDDRHFFPSYAAVLLYRLDAAKKFPRTWEAFHQLTNRISAQEMLNLNAQAELGKKSFGTIAKQFLRRQSEQGNSSHSGTFWSQLFASDLWSLTKQHLFLVFSALIPAIFVGVALGTLAYYCPAVRHVVLNAVGVIQTIPSLALLAFLIPIFREIGTVPALAALFLYSLLPIVRNTYAGLANIPQSLQDASLALGLPFFHRLSQIELPLASRTILAGIKTAAVLNVGMATIAALIGAGGYGERIVTGLALNDYEMLLSGAIPACLLAILVQSGFDLLDYFFIPKGLHQS